MGSFDDLLVAWRDGPDVETTLALCAAVQDETLAHEVLLVARSSFSHRSDVMLAVGRMLMRLDLFADAQTPLVLAGKVDPSDWRPFLELGRLLLRRGDADRGSQALQRALALGCPVEELAAWIAMAEELVTLQHSAGFGAVADEVEHRALPWPDDGSQVALGNDFVSQAAPTDPPPRNRERTASPAAHPTESAPSVPSTLSSATSPAPDASFASSLQGTRAQLDWLQRLGLVGAGDRGARWQSQRGTTAPAIWILGVAAVVSAFSILAAYGFTERVRAGRVASAAKIVSNVQRMHASGRVEEVRAAELELGRLFELDPNGPRVDELWLENRALAALWYPETPPGMSDALRRIEVRGSSPAHEVLGRIVQRFSARDVDGARQLLPRLDEYSAQSAICQLAAGVVLEHVGDPAAMGHYRRAVELDAELVPAKVMLARLALLERGAQPGRSAAPTLGQPLDDHPIGRCLRRLQWALDPTHERDPPIDPLRDDELALLPRPLRPMPHLVAALEAIGRNEHKRAAEQVGEGLALAETPAAITRLGVVALQAGDPQLARRAAVRVHEVAPEYPPLSVLAARIGLSEGRLNDAEAAVASANAAREPLAYVHAVASYELIDVHGVDVATKTLGALVRQEPELSALRLFRSVVQGDAYPETDQLQDLAVPSVLWGEVLALDSALDSGKLDLARTVVRSWGERAETLAPFAVRVARLARYSGEAKRAARFASHALLHSDPTPRSLIEYVWSRLALDEIEPARAILDTHRAVLGPYHRWLDVLVTKREANVPTARVRSSRLPLPRADAPLALWVLAARALVETGDTRGPEVLERLSTQHSSHPELELARNLLEE